MCIQCACLLPSVAYNVHTMCLLVTKCSLQCAYNVPACYQSAATLHLLSKCPSRALPKCPNACQQCPLTYSPKSSTNKVHNHLSTCMTKCMNPQKECWSLRILVMNCFPIATQVTIQAQLKQPLSFYRVQV